MSQPECVVPYRLQEGDQRSQWIGIMDQLQAFPEGSMGRAFAQDPELQLLLAGRKRPATLFDQPLLPLFPRKNHPTLVHLNTFGIETVGDILCLPSSDGDIKAAVVARQYLSDQVLPPHGRLAVAIYKTGWKFEGGELIVSPNDEQEMIARVDKQLEYGRLTKREREVLQLRFGLRDGIVRRYEDVGYVLKIAKEEVGSFERRALRKLSHPDNQEIIDIVFELTRPLFSRQW